MWEAFCYITVAGLGVAGLLGRKWLLPALFAFAVFWAALLGPASQIAAFEQDAARFAVMFAAGALMHQFRNIIPARWSLVTLSVVIVLSAALLDYRLLGALPLAYAVIVSGALIHSKHFRLHTDLSYGMHIYACPIQQLLVICGLASMNLLAFLPLPRWLPCRSPR
jgi:hypothetical protein